MHIVNHKKWFTKFHDFKTTIGIADNSTSLHVEGGGTADVVLIAPDGHKVTLHLSDVAYAPAGRCNLLSISMLAQKAGIRGSFDGSGMLFSMEDGREVGYATMDKGLYLVRVDQPKLQQTAPGGQEAIAALVDFDDPVWQMHRKLGHLSLQSMLQLHKNSDGMGLTEKQIKAKIKMICPVCATTRALVKIPRDPARGTQLHLASFFMQIPGAHTQ